MSSSMFIESRSSDSTSDSNLVVVYGKNGISFDDKGLENLIEEKKISSISVIRLTSPTPSMEEEEEEEAKLEEMFRRQELHSGESSGDEEKNSRYSDSDKPDGDNDACEDDSSDCKDKQEDEKSVEGSEDEATEDAEPRNKKLSRSTVGKVKRTSRKRKRVRPEIVGLRLEEFYPPEDANEIIKEALKMAGLGPDRKSKEDFEFQLFVIRNDHCYTPFTSPTQMKAKLAADKLDIEKQAHSRKVIGVYQTTAGGGKQIFVRKKLLQKQEIPVIKVASTSSMAKDKTTTATVNRIKKDCRDAKPQVEADCTEDDDIVRSSNDECDTSKAGEEDDDSECGLTEEESDESDNDRDSDLDFDVNNPKGRRRKAKVAKFIKRHSIGASKLQQKTKRFHSQEDPVETIKKSPSFTTVNRQKSMVKSTSDVGRIAVRPTLTKIVHVGSGVGTGIVGSCGQMKVLSPIVAALPPIPRKTNENKCSIANSLLSATSTTSSSIPHTTFMLKGSTAVITPPQPHREILINKQIMSSPKTKGFTDLSKLIDQNERDESCVYVEEQKSVHTPAAVAQKPAIPHKGFMPIGLETAATNQLPAQISIQTHQSSSELEAEHDKQLDLINSIVQDEMKKSNEVVSPTTNINKNIPELVKMLESTEEVLETTNISKKGNGNVSNINDSRVCGNANICGNEVSQTNDSTITDIGINNASLLATPDDDDLPDDILQLVDMMQDDKTLQEAVKVLGAGDCNDSISSVSSTITNQKPPPLTPIIQQHPATKINILEDIPHSSKSIIQMSISNLPVPSITPRSPITTFRAAPSKSSPLVRSEPIQIIRGNGRVITLPPIEAPTTRAKRRAQVQPHLIIQNTLITPASLSGVPININESSMDNSMHSNSSVTSVSSAAQEKKSQDNSNRRRGSKENVTGSGSVGNQKAKGKTTVSKKVRRKLQSEVGATESANEDDDDPNKLWCICRQPHNNRFMICCDSCEDWFHGTCVNITKAMGLEMEQKGIDWTCPKCVKKQEEKKQPKITDMLVNKQFEATPQLSADYYSTLPTATTAAIQPVVSDAIVTAINIQRPTISKIQAKQITKTVIDTTKTRLQPGQFINLKDLSSGGKKVIIQAATNSSSGQKKLFVTTQSLRTTSTTFASPIRTIAVVKHIPGHGNQIHQHQSIKVIRTIAPSKSPAQNFITTTASGSTYKSINSNDTSTLCIVCKKHARVNSIYCSDDCIRKHAQNALHIFMTKSQSEVDAPLVSNASDEKVKKKPKGLFEDLLSMADRKPKVERVNVYERKSGRILTGSSAPTISNLKKWLQENPTFEVVQPGSLQALDIEKKQKQRSPHSSSPTVLQKAATSPPPLKLLPLSSPVQQKTDVSRSNSPQTPVPLTLLKQTLTPQLKPNKSVVDFVKSSSPSTISRPGTPKQLQKYPQNVSIKGDKPPKPSEDVKSAKEKSNSTKRQVNTESCSNKSANSDGEPIRLLVRRTLKEQLLLRTQDEDSSALTVSSTDNAISEFPRLTTEEIEEFANATELEMYNYFNRDAGIKYKAKYRSLIFNIKDRKNRTLFAKICRKQIEPKQLVRMTPDEMASQELALWREQENKHQLEMIKKSELDLLSCAKNYVLKTHKGEEVIESKSAEYENVDISIPVEDVVAALNKTDFAEETPTTTRSQNHWTDVDSTLLSLPNVSELQPHAVEDKLKTSKDKDKDKERDKEKDRYRDRDRNRDPRERENRHKSKDRHRDKSHSRKRSRSHSRSRSRERNEKRHKSSHKDEKRDRDKDRVKDRSDRDQHGDGRANDKKFEKKTANISKSREISSTKRHQLHDQYVNPLETYNLIDQILESTKTVEEAANLVPDRDKDIEIIRKTSGTPLPSQSISSTTPKGSVDTGCVIDIHASPNYIDSDQEPTSTVSIPTPPHDPYSRFMFTNSPTFEDGDTNRCNVTTLWTGDINMVDVASFQLSVQPVLGNFTGLAKLLAKEFDVVGRIGPETVWDYISKIKKSPNKEIVIIRLIPANESETSAYKILYEYLDNRNRLGVVKSVSPYIKDFYIYPLGAGKDMPMVLRHSEPVEFYDDPCRPDMLIGIIIRVVGKRQNLIGQPTTVVTANNSIGGSSKFGSRTIEVDSSQSPPGSPKVKKRRQSIAPKDIDVDAIIKAPIVSKSQKGVSTAVPSAQALTDADEPYSPGGSSDDDLPLLPVKLPANSNQMQTAEDELKRKMEEINRQIAAQEMEIAGLLTGESSKFGSSSSKTSKVLANIAIPSNLSQILASIKPPMVSQDPLSAVPPPPPLIGSLIKTATSSGSIVVNEVYNPADCIGSPYEAKSSTSTSSRLANLSEAELLSMVPDDITIAPKPPPAPRYEEPPPPGV